MTLAEIEEASGIPARTIRFYIARGLLDGPVKGGRSAEYTAEHVARLERIKGLQEAGHTLASISGLLSAPAAEATAAPAEAWWHHAIADDVIVCVRGGASPWRTRQLRDAINEFARCVGQGGNGQGEESKK